MTAADLPPGAAPAGSVVTENADGTVSVSLGPCGCCGAAPCNVATTLPGRLYVTLSVPCLGPAGVGTVPIDRFVTGPSSATYSGPLPAVCGGTPDNCANVVLHVACVSGQLVVRNPTGSASGFFLSPDNLTAFVCPVQTPFGDPSVPVPLKTPGVPLDVTLDLYTGGYDRVCCPPSAPPFNELVGTARIQE